MPNDQPKSEEPQLYPIAATILTGLLASGDFTEKRAKGYTNEKIVEVRSDVVQKAIDLARELEEKLKA